MKIVHLTLNTPLLNDQRIFYEDVLGLAVIAEDDQHFTVQAGESQLTFIQSAAACQYHFAFNIPENQIEDARLWLAEQMPLIMLDGQAVFVSSEHWNAHQLYFTDPAGNILECIARHRLPNASDGTFGPAGLLSISEIGIATDDVQAALQRFEQAGLPVFDGRDSETFAVVGDDDGLLILVRTGRVWYPETGVRAEIIPLRVELGDGQIVELSGEADSALRIGPRPASA